MSRVSIQDSLENILYNLITDRKNAKITDLRDFFSDKNKRSAVDVNSRTNYLFPLSR